MAMTVEVATAVKIVDGGVSVVDREFITSYEITGKVEADYWLDAQTSGFTVCVKGTNITSPAIVDPFVVGLSTIRGYSIKGEVNFELAKDGAATPEKIAEGHTSVAQGEFQTLKITRDDTRAGKIELILWGDR
jgi:hypothetical protein